MHLRVLKLLISHVSVLCLVAPLLGETKRVPMEMVGDPLLLQAVTDSMAQHKASLIKGRLVGKVTTKNADVSYDVSWLADAEEAGRIFNGQSRMEYSFIDHYKNSVSEVRKITKDGNARIVNLSHASCKDYPTDSAMAIVPSGGFKDVPHLHWYDLLGVCLLDEEYLTTQKLAGKSQLIASETESFILLERRSTDGNLSQKFYFSKQKGLRLERYSVNRKEARGRLPAGQFAHGEFEWTQTDGVWWPRHIVQYRLFDRGDGNIEEERLILVENKSFSPDARVAVKDSDFSMSALPTGFLYSKRNALNKVLVEKFTGDFGKLEYQMKRRGAASRGGQSE